MKQKTIYQGKVGDLNVVIRLPQEGDAKAMCDYMNEISNEKTYITWQGEQMTLEQEEKYLNSQLEKIEKGETLKLLLFVENELAGISDMIMNRMVKSHIGSFGISISAKYRGKGLGKLLMKCVLDESKNLPGLKIANLEVFAKNENAIKMYKEFGFIEYGRLPGGNQYKGRLIDDVLMYKEM